MQFVSATVLLAVLISGIKTEAEPLTGPLPGSGPYKDSSAAHEYLQAFHHGGQHHGGGIGGNGVSGENPSSQNAVAHSILSSQIQDQSGLGGVGSQDQVSHGSAVPPHIVGPIVTGSSVIPPYFQQKSEVAGLHFGARAIGSPYPYYPSYYGKTYASPYYSQYQPSPYQAVYQPQSYYPYQYSASPYSGATSGGPGVGVGGLGIGGAVPYSASPYSSPVTPYSAYPYNYPYIPQYYPGYPSAASGNYYQSSGAAEIQSASKQ